MANYSPVSSQARASAKGLPRRMLNQIETNKARYPEPSWTNSRAKNYRLAFKWIADTYEGLRITHFEQGEGKQRVHHVIVLSPNLHADFFVFMMYEIHYKDPFDYISCELNFHIKPHAVQRLFQRFAGNDHHLALRELASLVEIFRLPKESATWELGSGNGMFILKTEVGDTIHTDVITWVDKMKLRPEQTWESGEYRKIK